MRGARDIAVAEAIELVAGSAPGPIPEVVPLSSCYGRVLYEDVASLVDHPNCDNSALDGFACREADTATASEERPVRLQVIGDVPAGTVFEGEVGPVQAVGIYTGAPVPRGANAIVRVEVTELEDGHVVVKSPGSTSDIRLQGEDLRQGETYLTAGTRLGAAEIGLAAAMGHDRLAVARQPRVGILSTGDEVVEPGEALAEGQVYNSNAYSLAGLVEEAGALPVLLPRVRDSLESLTAALREAGSVDLLLTSGGVSMGRYDFVRDLLFEHGEVTFWKVALRPGGPTLFGKWNDVQVLGLPGNPVSSMVVFLLIGRAWIQRAVGSAAPLPFETRLPAVSRSEFKGAGYKEAFNRGILELAGGPFALAVRSTGAQGSGILASMVAANCLVVVPPHSQVATGDRVEVIPLTADPAALFRQRAN